MLKPYTLKAKLNGKTNTKTVWASRDDVATLEAIRHIMEKAHAKQSSSWAIGEIVLTNDNGEILQTMEAKA